ncbi:type VI secretion system ImpA family N-terminal domain-containing protein [uncultured Rhodoblastus sp.]|uniref:type VI secretion system protein TssA n=1 Tax=uncultured Rhodoblastus sp. TaxID=543037 RepID=UPI002600A794|nr:type VI secretion system ImpA family N-terminal domain-containing protein [uncultured Rhodoblastus sp.]
MTLSLFDELSQPISSESACGPDLDLEGDADFMNFLARAEGILPGTFFKRDADGERERPFERGALNFQAEIAAARQLLQRTRDIRVLVVLAKLAALDRNLPDLVDSVDTLARLLDARWEEINPRAEDGDFSFRLASLQALDDMTHICLPLQFTPLIRHPRSGALTFRHKLLSEGLEPRDGEEVPDATTIDRAFMDIALEDLIAQRDRLARLVQAAETIKTVTIDRLGHQQSIRLDLLQQLSQQILDFLEDIVARRDPGSALHADETSSTTPSDAESDSLPAAAGPADAIATLGAVAAALAGTARYFARSEPSSPSLLLVRQAEQLVGKDFVQVMRILVPDHFDQAMIGIGKGQTFDLPIQRLSEQIGEEALTAADDPPEALDIRDRASANAALLKIEAYYARCEPSSPVPFLCERARKISAMDFMTLLKELLPSGALKAPDGT